MPATFLSERMEVILSMGATINFSQARSRNRKSFEGEGYTFKATQPR